MIETLEIRNFKSVKELSLPCKRFNLFIGEPDAGKSNLLEALGLLSFVGTRQYDPDIPLDGFARHEGTADLFYDGDTAAALSVRCGELSLELAGRDGEFRGEYRHPRGGAAEIAGDGRTLREVGRLDKAAIPPVRFYRRPRRGKFSAAACDFLLPPDGANLSALLGRDKELRRSVSASLGGRGLKLGLRPDESKIELVKSRDDDTRAAYPYSLAGDTLLRRHFHYAALQTNRGQALVFEEPESHSEPFEVQHWAEQIALDENGNQYFISTHNGYMVSNLMAKTQPEELAINVVYCQDYLTKVLTLTLEDMATVREEAPGNIFAILHWFLDD